MKKLLRLFSTAPWLGASFVAVQGYAQPVAQNGYAPAMYPGSMPFMQQPQVGEQPAYVQPNAMGCSVARNDATRLVDQNGVVIPAPGQGH